LALKWVGLFMAIVQIIHEPGKDSEKFDNLAPVIVKPIVYETYSSDNVNDVS